MNRDFPDKVVRELVTDATTNAFIRCMDFIYDESGRPFAMRNYRNSSLSGYDTYHYILNAQGDVVQITYQGGTVKATYTYDAWGQVLTATGDLAAITPLRYRGYYYDTETGFYYLQSRYYDPIIKRFINADTFSTTDIDSVLASNMFAYCENNPSARTDPTGEFFFTALGGVIGAGVGFFSALAKGEDPIEGTCNGFVTGAISGAGVDIAVSAVATGGASLAVGVAIAGTFGAISGVVDVGLSTDWNADPMEYVGGALVGGMLNCISFGLSPINGEILEGTIKEVTNQVVINGMLNLAENIITGTTVTVFNTLIVDRIKNAIQ